VAPKSDKQNQKTYYWPHLHTPVLPALRSPVVLGRSRELACPELNRRVEGPIKTNTGLAGLNQRATNDERLSTNFVLTFL
jgi:hypothetical protein